MFSVTLITVDRSPKRNFLGETLENLKRGGMFASPLLSSFQLVDSGSPSLTFAVEALTNAGFVDVKKSDIDSAIRLPTQNAARALRLSHNAGTPWCLFLEDDIDVCADFLESTASWLEDHAPGFSVFPLGANYDHLMPMFRQGRTAWQYPIEAYYGTLAVAIRHEHAGEIAAYLEQNADRQTYDLLISEWARRLGITHFCTPIPSFVQHIGVDSVIRPGSIFHQYETWQGRNWSYRKKVSA